MSTKSSPHYYHLAYSFLASQLPHEVAEADTTVTKSDPICAICQVIFLSITCVSFAEYDALLCKSAYFLANQDGISYKSKLLFYLGSVVSCKPLCQVSLLTSARMSWLSAYNIAYASHYRTITCSSFLTYFTAWWYAARYSVKHQVVSVLRKLISATTYRALQEWLMVHGRCYNWNRSLLKAGPSQISLFNNMKLFSVNHPKEYHNSSQYVLSVITDLCACYPGCVSGTKLTFHNLSVCK